MQFLVHRCVRNQVIFSVAGILLALAMVWSLSSILKPYFEQQQAKLQQKQTQQAAASPAKPKKTLEQRKRDITQYLAAKYKKHSNLVRMYVDIAFRESKKNPDVKPELILAIIQKESSLSHEIKNRYGAEGLMQVVRRYHREKLERKESLLNPKVNIRVGAQIMQEYINHHGDLVPALVRYSGNANGYADFVLREMAVLQAI